MSRDSKNLPFVFLNLAMTADGKIAPTTRHFEPFGSKRDQQHMLELRATADAIMSGARTLDLSAVSLGPGSEKYRRQRLQRGLGEYNLRIIVSGSGSIDPQAEIFKHHFSPIILLTTERAPKAKLKKLQSLADEVKVFGEKQIDFAAAFRWLKKQWNVNRLLCEGGGELDAGLFEAGLVDEIHLTICPVIFGGRNSPTLSDGEGFKVLQKAPLFELKSKRRHKDEMFLIYRRKAVH